MNSNYKGMRAGFATVTTLFFMWGFITVSIDPLIAALKAIFELIYAEAMLTQFAFFMAYFVVSLPAAALIARLGNSKSIMFALGVMVLGCLIVPAATILRHVFAGARRAVRDRERHHHPAGRRESAGRGARPAGTLALPPDVLADLQFARHFPRAPARRSGVILAGGIFAVTHGAEVTPELREESFRKIDSVFFMIAGALRVARVVHLRVPQAARRHQAGRRRTAPFDRHGVQVALGCLRRVRNFPVRRRRGVDRQRHDELPARTGHAEHPAGRGRQDGQLLLGRRDGRPPHRQRPAVPGEATRTMAARRLRARSPPACASRCRSCKASRRRISRCPSACSTPSCSR